MILVAMDVVGWLVKAWERGDQLSIMFAALALVVALVGLCFALPQARDSVRRRKDEALLKRRLRQGGFRDAEIEAAVRWYVRPDVLDRDPAELDEPALARELVTNDLFTHVDRILSERTSRSPLLVLADSGMGKTAFLLNYYAHRNRRWFQRGPHVALVSLAHPSADQLIRDIPEPHTTLLLLDALDEDAKARENYLLRLQDLWALTEDFARVVITCRTQFFTDARAIPRKFRPASPGARGVGADGFMNVLHLYIAPFSDTQVHHYIRRRFSWWQQRQRRKALELARKVPRLSVRPMLLAHLPELVKAGREVESEAELYEFLVEAWLEREKFHLTPVRVVTGEGEDVLEKAKQALREFSERLAVDLYRHQQARGMMGVKQGELEPLARQWGFPLESWQISGRSLLNRNAEGVYKFAHLSILEYLFCKRLVKGDPQCWGVVLSDGMRQFLLPMYSRLAQDSRPLARLLASWRVGAVSVEDNSLGPSSHLADWSFVEKWITDPLSLWSLPWSSATPDVLLGLRELFESFKRDPSNEWIADWPEHFDVRDTDPYRVARALDLILQRTGYDLRGRRRFWFWIPEDQSHGRGNLSKMAVHETRVFFIQPQGVAWSLGYAVEDTSGSNDPLARKAIAAVWAYLKGRDLAAIPVTGWSRSWELQQQLVNYFYPDPSHAGQTIVEQMNLDVDLLLGEVTKVQLLQHFGMDIREDLELVMACGFRGPRGEPMAVVVTPEVQGPEEYVLKIIPISPQGASLA